MLTKKDVQKALTQAGWLTHLDGAAFNALFAHLNDNGAGLEAIPPVLEALSPGAPPCPLPMLCAA